MKPPGPGGGLGRRAVRFAFDRAVRGNQKSACPAAYCRTAASDRWPAVYPPAKLEPTAVQLLRDDEIRSSFWLTPGNPAVYRVEPQGQLAFRAHTTTRCGQRK